jgi:hypothetical protein
MFYLKLAFVFGMQFTKNNEIESDVYDEFLAIDLTEQKEFEE